MLSQYLRVKEAASLLGFSPTTIWRRAKDPRFPKPVKFGARITVFNRDELLAWAESQRQEV